MAKDANWGFMIWDGVSKGTLTNIMNLLNSEKKVLLFSGPAREFFTLKSLSDLHSALDASGVRDAKLLLARLCSPCSNRIRVYGASHCLKQRR